VVNRPSLWLRACLQRLLAIALPVLLLLAMADVGQAASAPALVSAIERIQQKGELRVGIPPYNTPPYYYKNKGEDSLAGYDIEVARALAKRLGVDIVFDRQSSSFDDLVRRAGRGEVDLAIGKLGTTYPRLYNAYPHEYMRFHQALLIHRRVLSQIGRDSDPRLGEKLKRASLRIGAIHQSAYDTYAKDVFPKAEIVAVKNWDAAKEALFSGRVDAIYRDATEIRMLTLQNPRLTLLYAPLVIADMLDVKSIYVGEENRGIGPLVDFLVSSEFGVPDEREIIRKYPQFYRHRLDRQ
jgi:polar amino acid transport system substrate-binding protein